MMRLAAETWMASRAAWRMFTFRKDWQAGFDVSVGGFWRSFLAIVPAIPMIAMIHAGMVHAGSSLTVADQIVAQTLSWLIFPLAGAIACVVTGSRAGFVRWIVVHNWAVLWLYFYLFLLWTVYTAGLLPRELMALGLFLYPYLRVLAHWRIAYAALGLPTITAALAAAVPVLAIELAIGLYLAAAAEPAVQASAQASGG
jgi:hypothetical protein